MPTIAAIDLGEPEPGQTWDDLIPITLSRRQWHIIAAAVMQMGTNVLEGLEEAARAAQKGDVMALLVGQALSDSNDDLREVGLALTQTLNPALFEHIKQHARANADA